MNQGKYVFSQVLELIHRSEFDRIVRKFKGNHRARTMTCRQHLAVLMFGQLSGKDSLRSIVICLVAHRKKLYHLGMPRNLNLSTLSEANGKRDWRIYESLGLKLIGRAKGTVWLRETGVDYPEPIYAFDSSTVDLCLSLYPWADFRSTKAGVKIHAMLEINTELPVFVLITEASLHDVKAVDAIVLEAGAVYIMDRAYVDWARLSRMDAAGCYFVTRAKKNFTFRYQGSRPVDKSVGLICDQTVKTKTPKARKDYPGNLRRIKYRDEEHDVVYVFLTNMFEIDAYQIAEIYRNRWKVETFFKWMKGNLKIKRYWGLNENAVKTQIWVAISTYVLVALLKEKVDSSHSMKEILEILSVSLFDKTPVNQLLNSSLIQYENNSNDNQLKINGF